MKNKETPPICDRCGVELTWGGFAYEQNICFGCFEKEVFALIDQIDKWPSLCYDKSEEYKDLIIWMAEVIAEKYGYEF